MFIEFASVTSALRGLLRDGLADEVELSSRPIDELLSQPVGRSTLNVLLLSTSPMRYSASLPLSPGGRAQRPAPSFELLYLVTALGTEDLMAEALLEHAARRFDEFAILTMPRARLALAADGAPLINRERAAWAQQDARINIAPFEADLPTWLSVWTTLRASWRLSAMYTVSPVALAPGETAGSTAPVSDRPA